MPEIQIKKRSPYKHFLFQTRFHRIYAIFTTQIQNIMSVTEEVPENTPGLELDILNVDDSFTSVEQVKDVVAQFSKKHCAPFRLRRSSASRISYLCKYGFHKGSPYIDRSQSTEPTSTLGCPAKITFYRSTLTGELQCTAVENIHNHPLCEDVLMSKLQPFSCNEAADFDNSVEAESEISPFACQVFKKSKKILTLRIIV